MTTNINKGKKVWIFESNNTPIVLREKTDDNKSYIFDGLAADFKVNENGRLYSKDDYLPHIQRLEEKINSGALWGELDHPERYNVLVKEASHMIKELRFDEESETVRIKIELFDNEKGDHVKGMVDKGAPVFISSRASGYIDDEGNVILEKIYTYDIVSEPGFKNAKLERLNESLGIKNEFVGIYEMKETINTEEKNNLINLSTMEKNKPDEKLKEPITEGKFNEYTQKTSELFESLKSDFDKMKKTFEENTGKEINPEKVTEMSGLLETMTTNFNSAMDMFENHENEFKQLHTYTRGIGRTLNKLLEHLKTIDTAVQESKDFQGKIISHVNTVATLVNENVVEIDADITQLKKYHNLSARTTNEMVEMNKKLIPYINQIANTVNEMMDEQETTNSNVDKVTKHINLVSDTVHENFVEKSDFAFENVTGDEKTGFTADVTLDGDPCGKVTFDKKECKYEINENYSRIADTISKSVNLNSVFEGLYKEKYGVELATIKAIKENNLTGISRKVDEAINDAIKKSVSKKVETTESAIPFLKVISEEAKSKFVNLSEAKKQRVTRTVFEKTLLKATEIENAINVIADYSDDMILLESHLTDTQVTRWESCNEEKKDIIYSMFSSRVIRNKDEFDEFFESLDWRTSTVAEPLNEKKDEALLEGDKVLITEDAEDRYMDERLGLK